MLADRFDDAFGAVVAVVIGVFKKLPCFADQRVIDAPGVEADAVEALRPIESLPDFGP